MNLFNLSKTTEQEWNVQGSGVRIKIANNKDYDINDRPVIERWIEGLCWQNQGLATKSNSDFCWNGFKTWIKRLT